MRWMKYGAEQVDSSMLTASVPFSSEDLLSDQYTMFSRWNELCTRDVQQLGGFQFKDITGQWKNYDDASQTTLLDCWNPTGEPQAFNLNVQHWGYTIILDPDRTLHLTQIDSSGDVIGVQIAAHAASPVSYTHLTLPTILRV